MVELHTRYLGLDLRTPLVASASPLTGSLDGLRRLMAGADVAMMTSALLRHGPDQVHPEAR
jgi:dihydroorotate dehydrogenase (fumarate)